MTPAQYLFNIHFQICLLDQIQRNPHLPIGSIFENNVVAFEPQQAAAKIALAVDWLPGLHLRHAAGEPLEIGALVKSALQSGGGNFKRVCSVNEILDVEDRA